MFFPQEPEQVHLSTFFLFLGIKWDVFGEDPVICCKRLGSSPILRALLHRLLFCMGVSISFCHRDYEMPGRCKLELRRSGITHQQAQLIWCYLYQSTAKYLRIRLR